MQIFKRKKDIPPGFKLLRITVEPVSPPLPFHLLQREMSQKVQSTVLEFPMCSVLWQIPPVGHPIVFDYYYAVGFAKKNRYNIFFDETTLSYYFCYKEGGKFYINFFDTDKTLAQKYSFLQSAGLYGILPWPYGTDTKNFEEEINLC